MASYASYRPMAVLGGSAGPMVASTGYTGYAAPTVRYGVPAYGASYGVTGVAPTAAYGVSPAYASYGVTGVAPAATYGVAAPAAYASYQAYPRATTAVAPVAYGSYSAAWPRAMVGAAPIGGSPVPMVAAAPLGGSPGPMVAAAPLGGSVGPMIGGAAYGGVVGTGYGMGAYGAANPPSGAQYIGSYARRSSIQPVYTGQVTAAVPVVTRPTPVLVGGSPGPMMAVAYPGVRGTTMADGARNWARTH